MADYLTVDEFARWLKLCPETIRRWLRSGKVSGIKFGGPDGNWRIPSSEQQRFMPQSSPLVSGRTEKVFNLGCIQDAAGNMVAHMHPDGQVFARVGGQEDGRPCVWCERGVPRFGPVRRVVDGGVVQMLDAETGAQLVPPYRLGA